MSTIISSISNTLDPLLFYDALETNAVISKFKISVGAPSIVEPDQPDVAISKFKMSVGATSIV